jgi:hypothetical protein
MTFPYHRYETLAEPLKTSYPPGQEGMAREIAREIALAGTHLGQLLDLPMPAMEILLVGAAEWEFVPREDDEDDSLATMLPYWTDVCQPSVLVIPEIMDEIIGDATPEKRALLLYHELAHAFLASDSRPWPEESPLWADEWQLQFAAFWLFQQMRGSVAHITDDLQRQFADIFEPEPDGKTPVTVRGFDWYEDTTPADYLAYALLLEKFAVDLLTRYNAAILPRFLACYRQQRQELLSDEVTVMLGDVLGDGGEQWLEHLVYF